MPEVIGVIESDRVRAISSVAGMGFLVPGRFRRGLSVGLKLWISTAIRAMPLVGLAILYAGDAGPSF
jgi:hypothetical protein